MHASSSESGSSDDGDSHIERGLRRLKRLWRPQKVPLSTSCSAETSLPLTRAFHLLGFHRLRCSVLSSSRQLESLPSMNPSAVVVFRKRVGRGPAQWGENWPLDLLTGQAGRVIHGVEFMHCDSRVEQQA